jgi:uncharacterized protein
VGGATVSIEGPRGTVICERCEVADNPLLRLRGLLGRKGLAGGEGLLLKPAPAIHTCFMRFPIDAVFLDGELRVVGVSEAVRPWRLARAKGARSVIELAAGESRRLGLSVGDRLSLGASAA